MGRLGLPKRDKLKRHNLTTPLKRYTHAPVIAFLSRITTISHQVGLYVYNGPLDCVRYVLFPTLKPLGLEVGEGYLHSLPEEYRGTNGKSEMRREGRKGIVAVEGGGWEEEVRNYIMSTTLKRMTRHE